jgi:hypothetical protein
MLAILHNTLQQWKLGEGGRTYLEDAQAYFAHASLNFVSHSVLKKRDVPALNDAPSHKGIMWNGGTAPYILNLRQYTEMSGQIHDCA